jgi:hypothetical protein
MKGKLTTDEIRKLLDDSSSAGSDIDFIASGSEYREEVEKGQAFKISKYGIRLLDEHMPFKSSHLIMNIGHPNVGKSELDFFMMVQLSKISDLKFLVYSAENRIAAIVKKFITFFYGRKYELLSTEEKNSGFIWVDMHFMFILHLKMYTYRQLLQMSTRVMDNKFDFDGMLIDPYNALKLELKGLGKNDYNIQACEEMRVFCEQTGKSIILNCHTTTEAQRNQDKDGNVSRPLSSHVEGGGPFTSKADDVLVTHRNTRDKFNWMITELYVEKVRNQEYGGKITPFKEPIRMSYRPDRSGFDAQLSSSEQELYNKAQLSYSSSEPGRVRKGKKQTDQDEYDETQQKIDL